MPNLCGYCGIRVPYFERRYAHHRWFCSTDCLARWEAEPTDATPAAGSAATEHQRLSRGLLIIGLLAALVVAWFVTVIVGDETGDGMTGVAAGLFTLALLAGGWIGHLQHRLPALGAAALVAAVPGLVVLIVAMDAACGGGGE